MYKVVTDQWGARPPIYRGGDTFYPSMLPPDRDMVWAVKQLVVAPVAPDDPLGRLPPTGPTGDQTGVASDGWHSTLMPEAIPVTVVSSIVAAMRANGATPAMIEAVQRQAVPPPVPLPTPPEPASESTIISTTAVTPGSSSAS